MTSTPTSWGLLKQPYKQEAARKAAALRTGGCAKCGLPFARLPAVFCLGFGSVVASALEVCDYPFQGTSSLRIRMSKCKFVSQL